MLFERGIGWLAGAVARVIWGAGRRVSHSGITGTEAYDMDASFML